MEYPVDLVKLLTNLPASFSFIASIVILVLGLWLKVKKTDYEGKKSESDIQVARVESLMRQINLLSEELDKTRNQLADLHRQNLELMLQLREANKRIGQLEIALEKASVGIQNDI